MVSMREEDLPLMNALEEDDGPKVSSVDWDNFADAKEYLSDDAECVSDSEGNVSDDPEEIRKQHEPDEEGKFHDDPLWWGKTRAEIRSCTDKAKAEGNEAHREGDQEAANKHWKGALKGVQKLKDSEGEFRLRLNLAMGYTKLGKAAKALNQCEEALRDSLRTAVPSSLQAKAHYRAAEAYESAGEINKAMHSLRSAIQIEPGNSEARQKYANLKDLEMERRKREKALFGGKHLFEQEREVASDPQPERAEFEDSDENQNTDGEQNGGGAEKFAPDFDVDSLTDRSGADRIFEQTNARLGGGIDFVGGHVKFYGPLKHGEEAIQAATEEEPKGVAF